MDRGHYEYASLALHDLATAVAEVDAVELDGMAARDRDALRAVERALRARLAKHGR